MTTTKERYLAEIEAAIAKAKSWREVVTVIAKDGAEAYAYPKPEGRIAWGVNAAETGVNILRGIRRPDGCGRSGRVIMNRRNGCGTCVHNVDAHCACEDVSISRKPRQIVEHMQLSQGAGALTLTHIRRSGNGPGLSIWVEAAGANTCAA